MHKLLGLEGPQRDHRVGWAWLALCGALGVHVFDEAANGFLAVYNPTVQAVRGVLPWLPLPVFRFDVWLAGLVAAVAALAGLSTFVFRGTPWTRWAARVFGWFMLLNAVGHVAGTLFGRTVASVQFAGPMPGVYSSPLLAAAALCLLYRVRRSASGEADRLVAEMT